jgi:predicted NAD/FAD-dependent oxidoreductase
VRAVVVGAGLAGLVAADELVRGGVEVVVLEARDRVGGRVWSQRLPNGAVVEMGAEYILPGNTEVLGLVDRFGLGLWAKGMHYGWRDPVGGAGTTHEELAAAVDEAERALSASPGTRDSARDFLNGLDIPPGAREAILARVEISCANTADRVEAADLTGVAHIDREPSPSIAGGNQRLPLALAEELGDAVRLDSAARVIAWGEGGARVATDGGSVEADVAVVAVPAGVLDAITFDPPLPDAVRNALGLVEYGHAAKLFVPLREPAPPRAVMSVPDRYWCWTATGDGDEPQPRRQRVRRLEARPRRARRRRRPWPLARLARTPPRRPRARPRRRRPVHLGGRPLGPRRLLDLAAAGGRRGGGAADRSARLRRRAHRGRAPCAHGGRDQERAARGSVAAAPVTSL